MSKVLVTGGCGYIGSHTIVSLLNEGHEVISIDNLVNSYIESLAGIKKITGQDVINHNIDLCDGPAVDAFFSQHDDIDAIIHFAALKAVGESVKEPLRYFQNNVDSLLHVLKGAQNTGVKNFIFSSSCTVYGQAVDLPVTETTEMKEAESPYGRTKQIGEQILKDLSTHTTINVLSLRYFNPAGAHPTTHIGESARTPALNLVPVITETAAGKRKECTVFGDDYDTRDGSCIRDYIHVMDLADAHKLSVGYLLHGKNNSSYEVFNLGIGEGVSVLEAITAFEKVSGKKLNYKIGPRRPGDVIAIYSNYKKAKDRLGWNPQYGVEDIMRTAWDWEQKRPY